MEHNENECTEESGGGGFIIESDSSTEPSLISGNDL